MRSLLYVSPGEGSSGSGGPGGDPNDPKQPAVLTKGFVSLAFGVALGFALMFLKWTSSWIGPQDLKTWLDAVSLGRVFVYGLAVGTVTACVYNLIVAHHINLFGLESRMD